MYNEEDFLQLAGIQHFSFCKRQWALIHIEQIWSDNVLTVTGNIIHERAHDELSHEKRGELLLSRGMPIKSYELGVSGACDVVEFHQSQDGILLSQYDGFWKPCPVEYKRGSEKMIDADRLQLCAQAICLEEMFCCPIQYGYLFYNETRSREKVEFTDELRKTVKETFKEMHSYFEKRYTPKVKTGKQCNACSIKNSCIPKLNKNISAKEYINSYLNGEQ